MHAVTPVLRRIYLWSNGMVMVFDEMGDQLPDYQGPLAAVAAAILRDANWQTEFFEGHWGRSMQPITRSEFADKWERKGCTP
jgi:hypothetical protein